MRTSTGQRLKHQRFVRHAVIGCALIAASLVGEGAQGGTPGARRSEANWSMFRGNARLTGVAHAKLPKPLKVQWRLEIGEAITSSAAIVDGVVYVGGDDAYLYALSLDGGSVKWKYQAKEMIRSSPAVIDGVVLFGDDDGMFHAVDARTGIGRWTFQTEGEIISSANPQGDRVVFGSYGGFV